MELKNIISSDFIIPYLERKFPDHRYLKGGKEFTCNSIFYADHKKHLSINTGTGKWRDFKSDDKGDFTKLYSILENLSYSSAEIQLVLRGALQFNFDIPNIKPSESLTEASKLNFSDFYPFSINSTPKNEIEVLAWKTIYERKLFPAQFYLQLDGRYSGRLVVPFINKKNEVFFWQARSLIGQKPKYIMPSSSEGAKAGNILYPYDEKADILVITEGPLDSLSLQLKGINSTCTMGCHISDVQMEKIAKFQGKIILGYDNDKAGIDGCKTFNRQRKKFFVEKFYTCFPKSPYKDWNDMLVKDVDIKEFINENINEFNSLDYITFK